MHNTTPLGEKIKLVRNSKGLSLENMAFALKTHAGHLSRIERGQAEINPDMLAAIRTFLDIENAPLLESELELYKQRLWTLNEMLDANRMDMVNTLQTELVPIRNLPYEKELNMLYSMLVTRTVLKQYDFNTANQLLKPVGEMLDKVSIEVRYLYHRNMGFIDFAHQNNKEALAHYLQTLNCKSDKIQSDIMIICNIGFCYAQLGKPIQGILYLERFFAGYTGDNLNPAIGQAIGALAFCYQIVGETHKAKDLYEQQHIIAKNSNDTVFVAFAMANLCTIYVKLNDYTKGLDYCEQALLLVKDNETHIGKIVNLNAQYNKASCLLQMKDHANFHDALEDGKTLAHGNEDYTTMFDALYHASKLGDNKSREYLEDIALPFYIAGGGKTILMALELCETLESYYLTRGRNAKKADAIARISRDIYKDMFTTVSLT